VTPFDTRLSSGDFCESELRPPDKSLDEDEVGTELDEGYSAAEHPSGVVAWGTTQREEASYEDLGHRLAREEPDMTDAMYSDGIGNTPAADGEPIEDHIGDM
jgi:hypothetical protein